jgi:heat shock protein HslJ
VTAGDSANSNDDLVGTWHLVSVRLRGRVVRVRRARPIRASFEANGTFVASDGINMLSGRFRRYGSSFVTFDVASTLKGYVGDDPTVRVIEQAIALTLGGASTAEMKFVNDDLHLTSGPCELLYRRH